MPAIIIIFKIVPTPGLCFSGSQINRTTTLDTKVAKPMVQLKLIAIPSARTSHGLSPIIE